MGRFLSSWGPFILVGMGGWFVGVGTIGIILETNLFAEAKEAIEECEKELPRDQSCKIIGVIDNVQD